LIVDVIHKPQKQRKTVEIEMKIKHSYYSSNATFGRVKRGYKFADLPYVLNVASYQQKEEKSLLLLLLQERKAKQSKTKQCKCRKACSYQNTFC